MKARSYCIVTRTPNQRCESVLVGRPTFWYVSGDKALQENIPVSTVGRPRVPLVEHLFKLHTCPMRSLSRSYHRVRWVSIALWKSLGGVRFLVSTRRRKLGEWELEVHVLSEIYQLTIVRIPSLIMIVTIQPVRYSVMFYVCPPLLYLSKAPILCWARRHHVMRSSHVT
jgi:hypothetical protein